MIDDMAGQAPMQDAADPGMVNATAEEQAMYERFVATALMGLYNEELLPDTREMLVGAEDSRAGVAEVAVSIGMRVVQMAQEAGTPIPGDIIMHGGKEIVEAVIELAEASGVPEFSPEDMEQAYYMAADLFTGQAMQTGDLDETALAADLPAVQQMRDSGALDAIEEKMRAPEPRGLG